LSPFLVAHLAVAIGAKTRATYWLDKGSNRLPRVFFISKSSVDSLERFRKPKLTQEAKTKEIKIMPGLCNWPATRSIICCFLFGMWLSDAWTENPRHRLPQPETQKNKPHKKKQKVSDSSVMDHRQHHKRPSSISSILLRKTFPPVLLPTRFYRLVSSL
jgi:hypothetical protein